MFFRLRLIDFKYSTDRLFISLVVSITNFTPRTNGWGRTFGRRPFRRLPFRCSLIFPPGDSLVFLFGFLSFQLVTYTYIVVCFVTSPYQRGKILFSLSSLVFVEEQIKRIYLSGQSHRDFCKNEIRTAASA